MVDAASVWCTEMAGMTFFAAIVVATVVAATDTDVQANGIRRNTFLQTELIAMGMTDQDVRMRWISYMKEGNDVPKFVMVEAHRVDTENLKRLKEIVEDDDM